MTDDRVKRVHGGQLRAHERAQGKFARRHEVRRARADVHANRQVQAIGFFVERKEIRIGGPLAGFEIAFLENAAGAVIFGELQFLDRLVHVHQRRQTNPAQAGRAIRRSGRRASDCSCAAARSRLPAARWLPSKTKSDKAPALRCPWRPCRAVVFARRVVRGFPPSCACCCRRGRNASGGGRRSASSATAFFDGSTRLGY